MPEDSVNPIPTERGVVQPTCTVPLGYRNCRKTNFDWTVYLLGGGYEIYLLQIEQSDWTV